MLNVHMLIKDSKCIAAASDWGVCTKYSSGAADQIQRLGTGLWRHAEGQKYAARGMFRSTVSRQWPSSGPISPVCLPWNAATDSNSSLEQLGIIRKRVAKSTRRLLATPPPLLWALWIWIRRVFNASKRHWRLSDARFNPTIGRLCVQGQEPPSQRNHL